MIPAIPLPFVLTLLLAVLLVRLIRQGESTLRPAIIFVGACTALTTIVGLRWTFDIQIIRFVQPIVASLLPPSAWLCFAQLRGNRNLARRWLHAIPVGMVAILSATWMRWHPPIDLVLAGLFFGYGFALLRLSSMGPDGFGDARLADAPSARKATLIAGLVLVVTGLVDLLIAGDFDFYQGAHAASIVAVANMLTLPLIAYAVAIVGKSVPAPNTLGSEQDDPADGATPPTQPEPSETSTEDDARIVEAIDKLMRERQPFRDPDLTLNRLARRAGIPARQVSAAINRALGKNVSQVVNEYRIDEAKRLLQHSDLSVTSIIFEAGFQTKSNFNREFLRVTGVTPSEFRQRSTRHLDQDESTLVGSPSPETQ